jgi:hypothetical protein
MKRLKQLVLIGMFFYNAAQAQVDGAAIKIQKNGCDFSLKQATIDVVESRKYRLEFLKENNNPIQLTGITVAGTIMTIPESTPVSKEISFDIDVMGIFDKTPTIIINYTVTGCGVQSLAILKGKELSVKKNSAKPCPFKLISNASSATCSDRTYENFFGENIETFDKNKIVYIYDFNKNVNKRGYYKIQVSTEKQKVLKAESKFIYKKIKHHRSQDSLLSISISETRLKNQQAITDTLKYHNEVLAAMTNTDVAVRNMSQANFYKAKKEFISSSKQLDSYIKLRTEHENKLLKAEEDYHKINNRINARPDDFLSISNVNFNNEVLQSNKNVQFKVVNINRFIYDVAITDTLVDFDSSPSPLLRQLFIGDSAGIMGSLLNTFSTNINTSIQSKGSPDDEKYSDIECFIRGINSLKATALQAFNPCSQFPCCAPNNTDFNNLANKLTAIKADLAAQEYEFNALKKELSNIQDKASSCKSNDKQIISANQALDRLKAIRQESLTATQKDSLNNKLPDQLKVLIFNKCRASYADSLDKQIAKLKTELEPYRNLAELNAGLPLEDELRKLTVFINNMTDQNQTYSSDYINLRGNRIDLNLTIKTKETIAQNFSIPTYNNKTNIEIPVIRNPFVSFSTGSFIGIGDNLRNKRYTWQELPVNNTVTPTSNSTTPSNYKLVESDYTPPVAGFAALANFETKLSRNFAIGGSGGVGLTIEKNPRLSYIAGGSVFLGDLRQFAITFGVACMQVNELKNNFKTIADDEIVYTTKVDIEYTKQFKVGGIIAITYTPFKVVRKQRNKK